MWKVLSMAFPTPTLRFDLQCGQLVEKSAAMARIMSLNLAFRRTVRGRAGLIGDGWLGV